MLDHIKRRISVEVRDNKVQYLVLIFFLVVGITAGTFTVSNMKMSAKAELSEYINLTFVTIKTKTIDYFSIFVNSFLQNMLLFAIITMASLAMVGIPVIATMMILKGFFVGFSVAVLSFNIGFGGLAAIVSCMFLPNIVLIPCILRSGVLSIDNAIAVIKNRKIPKTTSDRLIASKPHLTKVFKIFLVSLIGVGLESFLTPMLIRLI